MHHNMRTREEAKGNLQRNKRGSSITKTQEVSNTRWHVNWGW